MSPTRLYAYLIDNAATTQLLFYATIMISVWMAEKLILVNFASSKWQHTSINALFIIPALPIQILLFECSTKTANWTTIHHWGLINHLPHANNPIVKYLVAFFILDLLDYVYHFLMHKVPFFWRFHLVHHTDRTVDVSTTLREHPGETLIRNCFLILWIFLTGASVGALILRQGVESFANIFAHTSFRLPRWPAQILGWLFVTPNFHHVHHHYQMPATNCNFGDVFSIWDRLFSTTMHLEAAETQFGLDSHWQDHFDHDWPALLICSFATPQYEADMPSTDGISL